MPARLSDVQANNGLDVRFNGAASNAPATAYLALCTTAPTTNTGTGLVEMTGSGYARVAATKNATNWPLAASRAISNGVAFTWPTSTGYNGSVVGVARFDAATSGTYLDYFDLTPDRAIASGDTPTAAVGSLTATSSGA